MNATTRQNSVLDAVIHATPGVGKFSTETIKAYQEAGWLKIMFTTLIFHEENRILAVILRMFPALKPKLKNRYFFEIPNKKISIFPWKELCRVFTVRFFSLTTADTVWEWAEKSFDKWVSGKVNSNTKIVHCYEHAALFTFKKATKIGSFKILEQVSQHFSFYDELLKKQLEKYPELDSNYNSRLGSNTKERRNERKMKELSLADLIICNSSFTMKTLVNAGVDENKILRIPLAYPPILKEKRFRENTGIFTFIYVGSLSIRKGVHILIDVWKQHFANNKSIQLILAGSNSLPQAITANLPKNLLLQGHVNKADLESLYDQADLLVVPTLADGFGMVITEAMARGLPVLTTENSAGFDLIENNVDGFLIPAGNDMALADKMIWINNNREILPNMANHAMQKAKNYQWADYRKLLVKEIKIKYDQFLKQSVN